MLQQLLKLNGSCETFRESTYQYGGMLVLQHLALVRSILVVLFPLTSRAVIAIWRHVLRQMWRVTIISTLDFSYKFIFMNRVKAAVIAAREKIERISPRFGLTDVKAQPCDAYLSAVCSAACHSLIARDKKRKIFVDGFLMTCVSSCRRPAKQLGWRHRWTKRSGSVATISWQSCWSPFAWQRSFYRCRMLSSTISTDRSTAGSQPTQCRLIPSRTPRS